MCQWRLEQKSRNQLLQNRCQTLGLTRGPITEQWIRENKRRLSRIIVSDEHRVLYCSMPKVANTNWKMAFMILTGRLKREDALKQPFGAIHKWKDWLLSQLPDDEILYRLQNYKSFMIVRHPFHRLLSAFKDKFNSEVPLNREETRLPRNEIYLKYHNMTPTEVIRGGGNNRTPPAGYRVSFQEFVELVLHQRLHQRADFNPNSFESHWVSMTNLCLPCLVNYDYIGKLESAHLDTRFILENIGADNMTDLVAGQPGAAAHATNASARVKDTFLNLSDEQMEGLRRMYEHDLKLYDYSPVL